MYHVHSKRLCRAIGETDNRHRKPVTLGRAIERVMLLDVVFADRETRWHATEADRRVHFTGVTELRPEKLPPSCSGHPHGSLFGMFRTSARSAWRRSCAQKSSSAR